MSVERRECTVQLTWIEDDHKMLVELACSTTLIPTYHPVLFNRMVPPVATELRCVVFIVCGGFKVSISDAIEFQTVVDEAQRDSGPGWEVRCDDGELLRVPVREIVESK